MKKDRIEHEMIKVISDILKEEVKNKDIFFVTITDVKVTSDLSYAKVYYRVLKDEDKISFALNQARGFIRKKLAEKMQLRHTPELTFIYDTSVEYGKKIEEVISSLHEGKDEK